MLTLVAILENSLLQLHIKECTIPGIDKLLIDRISCASKVVPMQSKKNGSDPFQYFKEFFYYAHVKQTRPLF